MDLPQIQQLYDYNRWANARVLGAATALSHESLTRDLGTSHRSVWDTLRHILSWEWRWLGRWQTRKPTGLDPQDCRDFPSLHSRWAEIEQEQIAFLQRLSAGDLSRVVTYDDPPGTRWTYTLGDMLYHVLNHSTYHRGQVAAMLRQLGARSTPTDYLIYSDECAGAG